MERTNFDCNETFEVEKIINRKVYKNKLYYLIKWLCYPINQSTWEPKSNLKNLNYMIHEFEAEYPHSIDQKMYNIYCEESKKKGGSKNKKKNKRFIQSETKFINKKRKIEFFSDSELNDPDLKQLKKHLYIDEENNQEKSKENKKDKHSKGNIVIDLSSTSTQEEENTKNTISREENIKLDERKIKIITLLIHNIL